VCCSVLLQKFYVSHKYFSRLYSYNGGRVGQEQNEPSYILDPLIA
jgi:hypothetical protein